MELYIHLTTYFFRLPNPNPKICQALNAPTRRQDMYELQRRKRADESRLKEIYTEEENNSRREQIRMVHVPLPL